MTDPFYQDELVTLYNAPCHEVMHLMAPEAVQLVVTSPPFNMGDRMGKRAHKSDIWEPDHWYDDNMPQGEYEAQQVAVLRQMARLLTKSGAIVYQHRPRAKDRKTIHPLRWIWQVQQLELVQEVVWYKDGSSQKNCGLFFPTHEYLYWLARSDGRARAALQALAIRYTSVWRINSDRQVPWHPCTFPTEIAGRCIAALSRPGETVFDPYSGSGTTLAEAKRLGRKAIGCEVRADYCQKSAQRLAQSATMQEGEGEAELQYVSEQF